MPNVTMRTIGDKRHNKSQNYTPTARTREIAPVCEALSVSMNFEVTQNLKGCKINDGENTLVYIPKLFSMTGELKDSSGKVLAKMKRTGWWNYSFSIHTSEDSNYVLKRKWGNTKLIMNGSDAEFETNTTVEFFNKGMKPATKFRLQDHFLNNWRLEILQKEHWQALLITSCFIHKLDIQSIGT